MKSWKTSGVTLERLDQSQLTAQNDIDETCRTRKQELHALVRCRCKSLPEHLPPDPNTLFPFRVNSGFPDVIYPMSGNPAELHIHLST